MAVHFAITEYIQRATVQAEYDKLGDGTFSGRIPCSVTFCPSLMELI
jgi:hypothetical protein